MNFIMKPPKRTFLLYLLPPVLLYAFTVFVPIILALYYGSFDWSGGMKMTFIGLKNYEELVQDGTFWQAFGNNLILTGLCVLGQVGLAFIFASLLNSRMIRWKNMHRTLAYLPSILSAVVVGFIWTMVYDYNYGLLNTILRFFGHADAAKPWLDQPKLSLFLVSVPMIWQYIGFYLVILLASFSSIDASVLEMAELDGATGIKKAVYITFPLIKRMILVCITLCIAGNMKSFDHIFVMTGGGPGTSSIVMALYAYIESFTRYRMGYGSAMSIMILILSLICIGGSQQLLSFGLKNKEE
jgi:raffinose/stachyose/melibiose transport system permease protein